MLKILMAGLLTLSFSSLSQADCKKGEVACKNDATKCHAEKATDAEMHKACGTDHSAEEKAHDKDGHKEGHHEGHK